MTPHSLTAWSHDATSAEPLCVGTLRTQTGQFAFNAAWHDSAQAKHFNPIGALAQTPQATALLTDSLPDSWGRLLIDKWHTARARRDECKPAPLTESDILSNVADVLRMGAVRFRADTHWVGQSDLTVPTRGDLAAMLELTQAIERNQSLSAASLQPLVFAGSALGGSRPKVAFTQADGALWIAKLPSVHDERNHGAWEYLMMQLARRAGITVADFELIDNRIFCAKRFDRTEQNKRYHYLSTRALLGAAQNREPRSYLEILMLIERLCGRLSADVEELYARVAFKMMVSDGDDHLRNHGFLLTEDGWHLAPAFDMNPSLASQHLCLTWDDKCSQFDLAGFIAAAPIWGIGVERAREIVERVAHALRHWRALAQDLPIAADEIEALSAAFCIPDKI